MSSPESLSSENVHKLLSDTNLSASSFVQSVLTTAFQSSLETTGSDVRDSSQSILDQLFSPNCEVRKDHAPQGLAELKDDFVARRAGCRTANVKFEHIISTNDDKPEEPAVVAGVFVITRYMMYLIRASPAQRLTYVYFSAKLEPPLPSIKDGGDDEGGGRRISRRFTSFYYTLVDKVPPIHFAVPHVSVRKDDTVEG